MPDIPPKNPFSNPSKVSALSPKPQEPDAKVDKLRPVMTAPIILGELVLASPETQTTVGAAGAASALPANPTGYLKIVLGNTEFVMPYYAQS